MSTKLPVVLFACALLAASACAPPPPNLSPQAVSAFNNLRVQKALDIIRDTARDAAAQTPPVIPQATANRVNDWHEAAIKVIHAAGSGWQAAVSTSLDELQKNLPAADAKLLAPYIALAQSIIVGVIS